MTKPLPILALCCLMAGAAPKPSPIDRIPRPVLWEMSEIVRMAVEQVGTEWISRQDANERWDLARCDTDYHDFRAEVIQNMPGDPETWQKAARLIGSVMMTAIQTEKERSVSRE